ncbi:MAG: hypothetical protein AAFW68_07600 [Pseudomonadota bacterium]
MCAALGDDLGAAVDEAAPAHWSRLGDAAADMALPDGAQPLSRFARAPSALNRRLAAIGVVDDASAGSALHDALKPGQRLVSRQGDLWRWDGFTTHADAKTAAAIRLEQRNRLQVLDRNFEAAEETAAVARRSHDQASETLKSKQANEREARALFIEARRALDSARTGLTELERAHERALARLASIDENLTRLADEEVETKRLHETLLAEQAALPDGALIDAKVTTARDDVAAARSRAGESRNAHSDLVNEARRRVARLEEIARDKASWSQRGDAARVRVGDIESRLVQTMAAEKEAQGAPTVIEEKRKSLLDQLALAETRRNEAADALAKGQTLAQEADRAAKAADAEASEAREARARLEAQAEAAAERVEEATRLAHETCEAAPEELLAIAEYKEGADLPEREGVERKLERYKRERENLGGVNLRADEEMKEVAARLEDLGVEREDCDSAIRKLRNAIGNLNREARQRLLDAFETVNTNFGDLFKRLFNGGQAELRLIDSEDPLEAGLEIFASPPGKKLASMSLMSGGEQALTATALIFAVFMANPAPVCVLDEVDAPLDDANVERFCRLLHEMAAETDTRFIIITHHALTMSRMSRLFGVTMIERGVSQLVSVDLSKAEQLAAAE